MTSADVVIVGAGPAGLAAATELRRRGAGRVVVYERELQAGGAPRHTSHWGYPVRDGFRVTTGPRYAAHLVRLAEKAGVELEVGRTVQSFAGGVVSTTGNHGPESVTARALLLATGVRERPRAARLVPGDRPAGVLTTGALQQFTTLHHQRVGRRAVVVGAEHVSFSAVMTLRHAGCEVAAMVTPLPRHQSYALLALASARRHRVPVLTGAEVAGIVGRKRVEAVLLGDGGRIDCDTVVFTGDWIPDHELARRGGLRMLPVARAPVVDPSFHTEQSGVFAIGNLVHPAESADMCFLDGRDAAVSVIDWLAIGNWPTGIEPLTAEAPIAWAGHTAKGITARVSDFVSGCLEVCVGDEVLHRTRARTWVPNRAIHLPGVPGATALRLAP